MNGKWLTFGLAVTLAAFLAWMRSYIGIAFLAVTAVFCIGYFKDDYIRMQREAAVRQDAKEAREAQAAKEQRQQEALERERAWAAREKAEAKAEAAKIAKEKEDEEQARLMNIALHATLKRIAAETAKKAAQEKAAEEARAAKKAAQEKAAEEARAAKKAEYENDPRTYLSMSKNYKTVFQYTEEQLWAQYGFDIRKACMFRGGPADVLYCQRDELKKLRFYFSTSVKIE